MAKWVLPTLEKKSLIPPRKGLPIESRVAVPSVQHHSLGDGDFQDDARPLPFRRMDAQNPVHKFRPFAHVDHA